MSTLFGHKKGAFTGAVADRAGLLKAADRGVLLLDEIGTLGLDEQAMLLCALEDKRFKPMGSDQDVTSEFQLLAGTNRDLNRAVAEGTFRADLLARLNVWSFTLPGLAERPEDFELSRSSERIGTRVTMNAAARAAFLTFAAAHPWPGNFRDLSACVLRMATLAEGGRITAADVAIEVGSLGVVSQAPARSTTEHGLCLRVLGDTMQSHDRFDLSQLEAVLRAIMDTDSMAQAGRELFSVSRAAKDNPNDSDRVRKFLTRWSLNYADVRRLLAARA